MTKTVHPVLKKTGAVLLTVLVLVLMAVPDRKSTRLNSSH